MAVTIEETRKAMLDKADDLILQSTLDSTEVHANRPLLASHSVVWEGSSMETLRKPKRQEKVIGVECSGAVLLAMMEHVCLDECPKVFNRILSLQSHDAFRIAVDGCERYPAALMLCRVGIPNQRVCRYRQQN